jgi:glycosyltransferase involved in cell wall biosynthesis
MTAGDNKGDAYCGPAVLQIVPSLDSGGAERSTVEIAGALARSGFSPLVVSEGGRMVKDLEFAGGEWIRMRVNTRSPLALARNARRLVELIRVRSIKLVHARSRAPAWSALWATRRTGVPFVTTWHGAYSANSALKRYYNSVMLRGDAVIANSQWTAEHICSTYSVAPKRLVIVRRGVDLDAFDPMGVSAERAGRLRAGWGAAEEDIVILCPGRMSRRKGQEVLVEAAARLACEGDAPRFRVVLAGDAQLGNGFSAEVGRAVERHGLGHCVVFAGHIRDMPAAYDASDIVVSASTEPEAFGRVAAEAAAMERPVVATDHGGARETVLHGVSGLLVPPGDAGALASALRELMKAGHSGRAAMGAQGRSHVLAHFTLARMEAETVALYRELLGPLAPQ